RDQRGADLGIDGAVEEDRILRGVALAEIVPVEADEVADLLAVHVHHPQDEPVRHFDRRAVTRRDLDLADHAAWHRVPSERSLAHWCTSAFRVASPSGVCGASVPQAATV